MSELRQDLVSGDWVIMAPERAKRPHDFLPVKKKRVPSPKATCPFEDLQKTGNWPPVFLVPNDEKRWRVAVIPNKYPALTHSDACMIPMKRGIYTVGIGTGYHDLVVSRDHAKNIADMPLAHGVEVFEAIQRRFRMADKDKCIAYVSAFFNWGGSAGASLFHPHYQLLALPIVPPEVVESLRGSERYFTAHHRCVHCDILSHELRTKKRIVKQNGGAVAFTPFTPKSRMEVSIYPKRHTAFFERTPKRDLTAVVAVLQGTLRAMRKQLNDPDLNFFIHTAPVSDQRRSQHYHWHIDVIPKILITAGFELSTGMDINVIDPDWLAALLRGKSKKA
jgi:UDPglucose--hexose-1-phosphate uridylyltransferase